MQIQSTPAAMEIQPRGAVMEKTTTSRSGITTAKKIEATFPVNPGDVISCIGTGAAPVQEKKWYEFWKGNEKSTIQPIIAGMRCSIAGKVVAEGINNGCYKECDRPSNMPLFNASGIAIAGEFTPSGRPFTADGNTKCHVVTATTSWKNVADGSPQEVNYPRLKTGAFPQGKARGLPGPAGRNTGYDG